jgi:hypothetical protein
VLEGLNETEKAALKKQLIDHNEDWRNRSEEALKAGVS